jgi:hypothetical protein
MGAVATQASGWTKSQFSSYIKPGCAIGAGHNVDNFRLYATNHA